MERDLEQLHLVLGFPGLTLGDPDYYAAAVLSTAFGGGMSSRLFQEVREKRGLVYTIHSFAHSYRDGGLFGIYAGTGEDEAAELMPVLCDETMKLADGFEPAELARAKAQMKAGLLMSLESSSARCEQTGPAHADPRHAVRPGRSRAPDRGGRRCGDRARRRVLAGGAADPGRARARSAGSKISSACGRGSASEARGGDGAPAQDLSATVPGPRRAVSARSASSVYLRPAERGDFDDWANLRARSRDFLTPWEPTWPADALSRPISAPASPAMPRIGAPTRATISLSSAPTTRWSAGSGCRTCGAASPRPPASATGSARRSPARA